MNTIVQRNKSKKKSPMLRVVRACVQIAFFIFLPALYISAFSELKIVFESIADGTFNIAAMLPQVIELLAIIPVTIILGRFFCGWMCAFGAFGDLLYGAAKKIFHIRFKINETSDRVLKFVKYGMLAFAIAFLWIYNAPGLASASPWDVFGMLATVGAAPNISFVLSNLIPGFIFFILIAIGSAFIQRFFCRYFCPLGAVFTILTLLRISRIVKPTRKCGNCRVCTNHCAMGIPLYKNESVHSGECIECLQCVSACPRHNIRYHIAGSDVRPLVAGTLAAIAITGIYSTTNLALAQTNGTAATSIAQASNAPFQLTDPAPSAASSPSAAAITPGASASQEQTSQTTASLQPSAGASASQASATAADTYKDGTYTGSGMGFRGQTTVSVTIKNGAISDIATVSTQDDQKWYQSAFSTLCSCIKSDQTSNVDVVSGATYSSQGIMEAVANALQTAKA